MCVCVCVHIDFLDGLAQEGNHLVIWPFDHLLADQCCLDVLTFTCLLCLEAMEGLLRMLGLATPCHTEGTSAEKMNLHCDRRDSQLTDSVRAPDADCWGFCT